MLVQIKHNSILPPSAYATFKTLLDVIFDTPKS